MTWNHFVSFSRVCVYVCWICHVHSHVQTHAPDSVHDLSLPLSTLFLSGRMVSCWTWTVHFSTRLAVSMLRWSFCVCPLRAGVTSMCRTTRAFCFFLLGRWDPSSGSHDCLAGVPALWAASLSSPFTCFFLYLDKWRPLTLMKLTPPSISLPLFVLLMLCLKNPNPSKIIKDCFPPVSSQFSIAFSFLALTISCDPSWINSCDMEWGKDSISSLCTCPRALC